MTFPFPAEGLSTQTVPGTDTYLELFTAWIQQTPLGIIATLHALPGQYLSQVYVTDFRWDAAAGVYSVGLEPSGVLLPLPEEE